MSGADAVGEDEGGRAMPRIGLLGGRSRGGVELALVRRRRVRDEHDAIQTQGVGHVARGLQVAHVDRVERAAE